MFMDARYRPEKLTNPNAAKAVLGFVNITTFSYTGLPDQTVAIAADEYAFAVVPVEMGEGEFPGLVPPEAFEASRTWKARSARNLFLGLEPSVVSFGAREQRQEFSRPTYPPPDYPRNIPDVGQEQISSSGITLGVQRLALFSKVLGDDYLIVRRFSPLGPWLIKPGSAYRGDGLPLLYAPFIVTMPLGGH